MNYIISSPFAFTALSKTYYIFLLTPHPFQDFGSLGEETIKVCLRAQLRQCQDRLRFLEAALRHHHTHAHHILTGDKMQREQLPLASVEEREIFSIYSGGVLTNL